MTNYIVLAFFLIIAIVICAVQLDAWGKDVPRWGDE